ncbi:MAG: hypothetical protein H7Z16_07270 [Pyrinomonadaceae bacterium]|nr:hypothetical protein [Pyrinomonadaceae bacterium]
MRKPTRSLFAFLLLVLIVGYLPQRVTASDFKREVVYQIITDRFFDGNAANNNPSQSAGLYDATKTNWRAYWGGDLQGVQQKMSYLAGLGITAIWISPPVDNLNANIPDGSGNPTASYHGYLARDFKRIEEHFGNPANTWADFDALVTAAHQNGIKVIVDFAPNHSTMDIAGEFGSLYDNGTFLGKYTSDSNGSPYTVLTAKLIPVTFTVNNASPTQTGDYIFLTGNTVELGAWSTTWDSAVGPMLTPNYPNWFITASVPAGQTIQFKFIKLASGGAVTWESGSNHTYTVPTSGTGFVNVNWQY